MRAAPGVLFAEDGARVLEVHRIPGVHRRRQQRYQILFNCCAGAGLLDHDNNSREIRRPFTKQLRILGRANSFHRKPFFAADLSLLQDLLEKANANILLVWVWQVNGQVSFLQEIRMWTAAEIRTFKAELP